MKEILVVLNKIWSNPKMVNQVLTEIAAAAGRLFKIDYHLATVYHLEGALEFLKENDWQVSLIVLEMLLPISDKMVFSQQYPDFPNFPDYAPGLGLLRYTNQLYPHIPFIITSVYLNDYFILRELKERKDHIIAQINPAEPSWHRGLKEAIRKVL